MKKSHFFWLFLLLASGIQAAHPNHAYAPNLQKAVEMAYFVPNAVTDCEAGFESQEVDSLTLQFTSNFESADSALAISWLWDFGDGETSTEENPAHLYALAGIYEVTLTIISASGCESTITEHVCVGIVPSPDCTASFEANPTDSLTLQFQAQFETVDSALAVLWLWDFGDGNTSNEENPAHTYEQAGIYEVTLTIESATGCISSITEHVCVGEIEEDPDCSVEPQTTQLDSLTFSFQFEYFALDSAVAVTWLWDFGDGNTSDEASPTHTYNDDGYYEVTLVVSGSTGCNAEVTFPVFTDVPPTTDCEVYLEYEDLDSLTYVFSAQVFNIDGDSTGVLNYLWNFGDGTTSNEANPTHQFQQDGLYTVTLDVVTEDSCQAYACAVLVIGNGPVDTFYYGCQAMFYVADVSDDSLSLSFEDLSFGGADQWYWEFGDGATSTEQNPTHTYADAGVYVVELTIQTLTGCESNISFEICVKEDCSWQGEQDCQALFFPLPDSLGGLGFEFQDLSYSPNPITSWHWDFGDGNTSNEQSPFHTYGQSGVYTITLIIEAQDCDSEISFELDTDEPWNFASNSIAALNVATGTLSQTTTRPSAIDALRLFPNPVTSQLHLVFEAKEAQEYQLSVKDLTGRLLWSNPKSAVTGLNTVQVDVAHLLPGLYLLEMRTDQEMKALKFVKQ